MKSGIPEEIVHPGVLHKGWQEKKLEYLSTRHAPDTHLLSRRHTTSRAKTTSESPRLFTVSIIYVLLDDVLVALGMQGKIHMRPRYFQSSQKWISRNVSDAKRSMRTKAVCLCCCFCTSIGRRRKASETMWSMEVYVKHDCAELTYGSSGIV